MAGRGTTIPPTRNASTAVSTGTINPPARCAAPSRTAKSVDGSCSGGTFAVGTTLAHATACLRPPSISRPISSSSAPAACSPTIASLVHDENAVREREHLVELERDEQDRVTLVPLGDEPLVHVLDRTDVQPARRLRRDQHDRIARDLARDDDLLLVAAGEGARERERPAAADVELLDQTGRPLDEPGREEPAALRVGRLVVVVQRDVLGEVELEHESAPLAVLRDVPDAGVEHRARRGAALRARVRRRRSVPLSIRRRPVIASIELGLPVAVDAGDRRRSRPLRTVNETPRTFSSRGRRARAGPSTSSSDVRRRRAAPCRRGAGPHARPSSAPGPPRSRPARDGVDPLAAPEHRDPVRDLEHLVQLVADEDDRLAVCRQAARRSRRARPPPAASARPSARRGSGSRRPGTAPSGSRPAAPARR